MSENILRYSVLVAVDFSELTDSVIKAAAMAADSYANADIHAVCVLDPQRPLPLEDIDHTAELAELERTLKARTNTSLEAVRKAGFDVSEVHCHTRLGSPSREIVALAHRLKADLIVLGRHGHSGSDILGSVPARVLQIAHCSVLVVQPSDYPGPKS